MEHYRIYSFDLRGHITAGHDALCVDDQHARLAATALCEAGRDCEIWCGRLRVGRIDQAAPPVG